jgi:hypothetical protein
MKKSLLKKIAKIYGVDISEVQKEMQLAINIVYENPNAAALAIPKKGVIPNADEFIHYCADEIKKSNKK